MTRLLLALVFVLALVTVSDAAFVAGRVTVAVTATQIYRSGPRGGSVLICNRDTVSVFLGPAGVTTANGFELGAADCTTQRPFPRDIIYGIVAAATARVDYAEGMYREP
jgi:hypothetical protein